MVEITTEVYMRCKCCDMILSPQNWDIKKQPDYPRELEEMCKRCISSSKSIYSYTRDKEYLFNNLADTYEGNYIPI